VGARESAGRSALRRASAGRLGSDRSCLRAPGGGRARVHGRRTSPRRPERLRRQHGQRQRLPVRGQLKRRLARSARAANGLRGPVGQQHRGEPERTVGVRDDAGRRGAVRRLVRRRPVTKDTRDGAGGTGTGGRGSYPRQQLGLCGRPWRHGLSVRRRRRRSPVAQEPCKRRDGPDAQRVGHEPRRPLRLRLERRQRGPEHRPRVPVRRRSRRRAFGEDAGHGARG
jgi:hypothetical protein